MSLAAWRVLVDDSGELHFDAVEALARDIFEMVNVSDYAMRPLNRRDFTQYLVALLHAVQMRIPDPEDGPHIYYRFETLDPEYREGLRESLKGVPDAEDHFEFDRPLTEVTPSLWAERKYLEDGRA